MAEIWRDILDEEIEELFIALSDETRRKILKVLDGGKEMNVSEIASNFPSISRPNISHHLGILKRVGILASQKKGKENIYSMDKNKLVKVLRKYTDDLDKRCC